MNKLSKSLIAILLVGSVVKPVFAEQKQVTETLAFEAVDYEALFASESNAVEVAACEAAAASDVFSRTALSVPDGLVGRRHSDDEIGVVL